MKNIYEELKCCIIVFSEDEDVITTSLGADIDPWQDDIFND